MDSLNFVKKFSIKKGEKKNPDNAITIEIKIKKIFNLIFFSPLTSLGSKYLYEIEDNNHHDCKKLKCQCKVT